MSLDEALARAARTLAAAGVASPEHDARMLALHLLGLWRPSDLATVDDIPQDEYDELVAQRAQRIPLQHLVGSAAFRYLEIAVGPGVFVPRPETEVVVDWAVKHAPANPLAIDLCSGSGAIALSLAHELPGAVVHAVEVDPVALKWARRNDPEAKVAWHLGPVGGCLSELDGAVDVVVSNPPYLPVGSELDRETAEHDPPAALWGGADGLDVVREVEQAARRLLKAGGLLVVEHDVTHGQAAPALLRETGGWGEIADHDDLTHRPRFVTARWQG